MFPGPQTCSRPYFTCGKQLWSSRILSIPWGFVAMRSMQGWLSLNGMSCHGICSLLYSSCGVITWHVISSILHSINQVLVVRLTHLLLPENHPVEEELHVLVCIIDAKLLEAVEGQILSEHTHNRWAQKYTQKITVSVHLCVPVEPGSHLKSINVQDGDGEGVLARIHLSVDPLC